MLEQRPRLMPPAVVTPRFSRSIASAGGADAGQSPEAAASLASLNTKPTSRLRSVSCNTCSSEHGLNFPIPGALSAQEDDEWCDAESTEVEPSLGHHVAISQTFSESQGKTPRLGLVVRPGRQPLFMASPPPRLQEDGTYSQREKSPPPPVEAGGAPDCAAFRMLLGTPDDPPQIQLWPCGRIPYRFDPNMSTGQPAVVARRNAFQAAVAAWNQELAGWVVLEPASVDSPHVLIATFGNANRSRNGYVTQGRLAASPASQQILVGSANVSQITHELGHTIGITHPQGRPDREEWFRSQTAAELIATNCERPVRTVINARNLQAAQAAFAAGTAAIVFPWTSVPPVDSFDYASIELNPVFVPVGQIVQPILDLNGNGPIGNDTTISPGDISRIHQYYSSQRHRAWTFFENRGTRIPSAGRCAPRPPTPWLGPAAQGAFFPPHAIGTPAATVLRNTLAVAVRSHDNRIYFSEIGHGTGWNPAPPIGDEVASDPATTAVDERIHIVCVNTAGQVIHSSRSVNGGGWNAWRLVANGAPPAGLMTAHGGLSAPSLVNEWGRVATIVAGRDGRYYFSRLRGDWTAWLPIDLGGHAASPHFCAASSSDGIVIATYQLGVTLVHRGLDVSRPQFGAVYLGNLSADTRPAIVTIGRDVEQYRLFASRPTGSRVTFPMLWTLEPRGGWEPIGGLPRAQTSPAACVRNPDANGTDGHLLMIEREPVDSLGAVIQPGALWSRYFE